MDTATIAAVAALVIAVAAFFVSSAQALQQYFITGQLIRICDSVVYGKMPGQGRRIWQSTQFRFRVLYSMPQISLPERMWPNVSPHSPSYARGYLPLPDLREGITIEQTRNWVPRWLGRQKAPNTSVGHGTGEASWVSFCRTIQDSCWGTVCYEMVERDADRCPSDLPAVPMQVSMRDIIVMALMTGMECTNASFHEKSLHMQGSAGIITSSQHPLLGTVLHFVPNQASRSHSFGVNSGKIDMNWMTRLWDNCIVAGQVYTGRRRKHAWTTENKWMPGGWEDEEDEEDGSGYRDVRPRRRDVNRKADRSDPNTLSTWERYDDNSDSNALSTPNPDTRKKESTHHSKTSYAFVGNDLPQAATYVDANHSRDGRDAISIAGSEEEVDEIPHGPHDGIWSLTANNKGPRLITHQPTYSSDAPEREERVIIIRRRERTWYERLALYFGLRVRFSNRRVTDVTYSNHEDNASSMSSPHSRTSPDGEAIVDPANTLPTDARKESNLPPPVTVEDEESVHSRDANNATYQSTVLPSDSPIIIDVAESSADAPIRSATVMAQAAERELHDRRLAAQEKQQERRDETQRAMADEEIVEALKRQGKIDRPNPSNVPLLAWSSDHGDLNDPSDPNDPSSFLPFEKDAYQRKKKRDRERRERANNRSSRIAARHEDVTWFWVSQMDILPGFWATPWGHGFEIDVCIGAVAVVLEALLAFTDSKSLRYCSGLGMGEWIRSGQSTYPCYALNARQGVVASGNFTVVKYPAFMKRLPPLDLLQSYDHQVSRTISKDLYSTLDRTEELMSLDSWLSICGRVPEITNGRTNLLSVTPSLVEWIMNRYHDDFADMERSASEGGWQMIQEITANLLDDLTDEKLSEAEQIFVLVAILRTVKTASCLIMGADTGNLQRILLSDVQAFLV